MNFQDLVLTLQRYWSQRGCLIAQPYDIEKGAATFNPSTFLRSLGPEPFKAAFIEPCRRPKDGRYGDNPNRMQHYYQFQVVLKPSPLDILDLYLGSLREIGIDPLRHDIRFVHDDWESPTLGAWGLGWEVWLDGQEVTQFTYFQQVGGIDLKPVMGEITYGLERLCMYLQGVDNVFKLRYNDTVTYGDIYHQNEVQYSKHNFEESDASLHFALFDSFEKECMRLCAAELPAPAFDYCMKASHSFNLLDARGAISVNERQGYILRVRALAKTVAEAWLRNRETLGFPLLKTASIPLSQPSVGADLKSALAKSAPTAAAPLLIELGVEEMPARVFKPLLEELPRLIEKHLGPAQLDMKDLQVFVTPRRIVLSATSMLTRQPDQKLALKGPPASIARDASGQWTKAAMAFAQKNSVSPDQLKVEDGYLCADVEKTGRAAADILSEALPKLFSEIHWYKTMRWGDGEGTPFVRPVTWLVALLGEQIIPVSFAGVESSDQSRGHRFLHNESFAVKADRGAYLDALRNAKVRVSQAERREKIRGLILETAGQQGLNWRVDEDLLDTVTWLVEWPVPVACSFDAKLLEIPEEVLVSEMREHQKLFALNDAGGKLSHHFVAISNMECADYGLIRQGNESVVRARFADAEFFLREDRKKKLLDGREDLKAVAFLKDLGEGASIYAKTVRIEEILRSFAAIQGSINFSHETYGKAIEIACLCKNDLTTQMVGEFPDLQGTIGRYYALAEGIDPIIANGILDHYKPRNASDDFPVTKESALVGIADRLDTLVTMFAIGRIPTGSADPFALRRACRTCIELLVHFDIHISLTTLLNKVLLHCQELIAPEERNKVIPKLLEFFKARAQNLFGEADRAGIPGGVSADTFDAAAGAKATWEDFPGLVARLQALEVFRRDAGFARIAETFKRVSNILKDGIPGNLDASKLGHPSEKNLLHGLGKAEAAVQAAVKSQAWDKALAAIATLQTPVAELFTAVMVNDPDPEIKRNRQALLQMVREVVLEVADFSAFQIG